MKPSTVNQLSSQIQALQDEVCLASIVDCRTKHGTRWVLQETFFADPVVFRERNFFGHPLAGLLWEGQFEEVLMELGWEKVPNWECLFVHRKQRLFSSVYVDDVKYGWKEAEYGSRVEEN